MDGWDSTNSSKILKRLRFQDLASRRCPQTCPDCSLTVNATPQRHSDDELSPDLILGHDGLNGQAKT